MKIPLVPALVTVSPVNSCRCTSMGSSHDGVEVAVREMRRSLSVFASLSTRAHHAMTAGMDQAMLFAGIVRLRLESRGKVQSSLWAVPNRSTLSFKP